jgi:apolipoprotein N-acyltransferase
VVLQRAGQPRRWAGEVALPLLLGAVVGAFGVAQTLAPGVPAETPRLKLALVQPSIPQQWIWAPEERSRRFQQLLAMSERALAEKPDVLVWPEAATPGYIRWETNVYQPITNLLARQATWLILGADDFTLRRDTKEPEIAESYNSAMLLSPQGEFRGVYHKRRLVIFGEYLPFHRWLPFLERWTGLGSFTPGRDPVPFVLPEHKAKTSVLICFEDVFPHLTREYVEEDTDFLLNLTNNGWFGESAAQWQHAANAVFRAVENGLPLVRCANNGLTCWVDAQGRMQSVAFADGTSVYGVGIKMVAVPLLGRNRRATYYWRHGDVFGWSCVAWSLMNAGLNLRRRREERPPQAGGTAATLPGFP